MLFSSVIDPEALNPLPNESANLRARDGLIFFLRGVIANGIVFDDSRTRMLELVAKKVDEAGRRDTQLGALFTEVLKLYKVRLPVPNGFPLEAEGANALKATCDFGKADCLLSRRSVALASKCLVAPEDYSLSSFEDDRRAASEHAVSLDRMSEKEREKFLERIFKHARWIRIYDKQIGRSQDVRHFRDGIAWLLKGRQRHGLFAADFLDIYTMAPRQDSRSNLRDWQRELEEDLRQWLTRAFGLKVRIYFKADPDGIFHARYLQTNLACVQLDRGFDLFRRNGTLFFKNLIRFDRGLVGEMREIQNLEDEVVWTDPSNTRPYP